VALVLSGCTASQAPIGVLAPSVDVVGVKLLRPDVVGRSCAFSVLGLPIGPERAGLDAAVARVLALDAEGDVVTNAEVTWEIFVSGVYNRRCVTVRGDLGRVIPTISVPALPGHHAHGGH
jgi:hypothetical protein